MFIVPIYRDDDSVNIPRAVVGLAIVNCLIWLVIWAGDAQPAVFAEYGFISSHPRLATAFTSMFVHSGFLHVLGNIWFLWMFGRRVENALGAWPFTLSYLLAGFAGTALHYALTRTPTIPVVGASGAISGVVGCFFVLFPRADFDLEIHLGWWHVKTLKSHTTAAIGTWAAEQATLALISQAARFAAVAFWAHIGGFAFGILTALLFKKLIPLDAHGLPLHRPWFLGREAESQPGVTERGLTIGAEVGASGTKPRS